MARKDTDSISVEAIVAQVRTMADNSIRIVFDLPEDSVYEAAWLMEVRRAEGTVTLDVKRT